jgi:hypothetical protein
MAQADVAVKEAGNAWTRTMCSKVSKWIGIAGGSVGWFSMNWFPLSSMMRRTISAVSGVSVR